MCPLTDRQTLLGVSEPPTAEQPAAGVAIRVLSELELSKQEDAVMSLAIVPTPLYSPSLEKRPLPISGLSVSTSGAHKPEEEELTWLALAGINSSESSQESGKNDHFRVFNVVTGTSSNSASISLLSKNEIFSSTTEVESYQRLLCTKGSLAAIASGGGLALTTNSEIVVIGVPDLGLKRRIRLPGNDEAADLDLSEGDGLLAYCTTKDIFITSTNGKDDDAPTMLAWQATPPIQGNLRSVRFCSSQKRIVVALNYPQRAGSELLLIDATGSGRILARKKLHRNIRAATGMDAISLGPHQQIVAVAGADQTVEILIVENDKIEAVKTFRDVHPFQITKVVFSPVPRSSSGEKPHTIRLATTSMGNTVVVFTLPVVSEGDRHWSLFRGSSVAKQTVFSVLLSLIGVVIFAAALQLMFEARAGLPLPMERNAILSRFNEVLGAKMTGGPVPGSGPGSGPSIAVEEGVGFDPYMVPEEVESGDGESGDTVVLEEVARKTSD